MGAVLGATSLLAALGTGLGIALIPRTSGASGSVTLSVANKGIVATGSLAEIDAQASSMAGMTVEIPGYLPSGSYVKTILVLPGPDGRAPSAGPAAAVDIRVPSGQYVVQEIKGSMSGLSAANRSAALSAAGKDVYVMPGTASTFGYAVVGKTHSFILAATTASAVTSAKADFPKMIATLSVE